MAQVEFRNASVQAHGFPQACVTCGNDEDNQLVSHPLSKPVGLRGCLSLLFLLFGPLGWLIFAYLAYRSSKNNKFDLRVPVCKLCKRGKDHLALRLSMVLLLAGLCFGVEFTEYVSAGWGVSLCGLLVLYGAFEYVWLTRQFRVDVVKSSEDGMIVQVPNEEYPSLYQRHLDNALLYGSSDSLGAAPDTDPSF